MERSMDTSLGWAVPSSSSCEFVFLWGCLSVRSSSCELVILQACLPVRLSSSKVVFMRDYHHLRLSSCEVIFLLGRLPARSSSCEVVFLWGCLPFQTHLTKTWYAYLSYIISFGTFSGCGGGRVKTKLNLHSSQQSWSWDELGKI